MLRTTSHTDACTTCWRQQALLWPGHNPSLAPAAAVTLSPCTLWRLPAAQVPPLLQRHPQLRNNLLQLYNHHTLCDFLGGEQQARSTTGGACGSSRAGGGGDAGGAGDGGDGGGGSSDAEAGGPMFSHLHSSSPFQNTRVCGGPG